MVSAKEPDPRHSQKKFEIILKHNFFIDLSFTKFNGGITFNMAVFHVLMFVQIICRRIYKSARKYPEPYDVTYLGHVFCSSFKNASAKAFVLAEVKAIPK